MKTFKELFNRAILTDEYWTEKAILEFTSELFAEMKRQGKSNKDLATTIGTSPAYITKVFSGNANFTIQSMVKLSRALDCRVHLKVVHETRRVNWTSCPTDLDKKNPVCSDGYVNFEFKGFIDESTAIAA